MDTQRFELLTRRMCRWGNHCAGTARSFGESLPVGALLRLRGTATGSIISPFSMGSAVVNLGVVVGGSSLTRVRTYPSTERKAGIVRAVSIRVPGARNCACHRRAPLSLSSCTVPHRQPVHEGKEFVSAHVQ